MNLAEQGRMAAGGQAQAATEAGAALSGQVMAGGRAQAEGAANKGNIWGSFAGQAAQEGMDMYPSLMEQYYSGGGGNSNTFNPGVNSYATS